MSKVSVVIPTRNRADTLALSLMTVVNQTHDNLEIIVSNNGGDPRTDEVVGRLGDARIRCVRPDQPLSMSHNFEFALSHVTGDWIVVIGDDDGLLPTGIERALRVLSESGADALGSSFCFFLWPETRDGPEGPYLSVPYDRGWRWRKSEQTIRRILDRDMTYQEAPTTYTGGMVRTELYQRIKSIKGTFYHSQIPDCYSAFAFCSSVERYVFMAEPFAIAGRSGHSHGGASIQFDKTDFSSQPVIPFHPAIPLPSNGTFTFSMQALIFESYLQTGFLRRKSDVTTIEDQIVKIVAHARLERSMFQKGDQMWGTVTDWARTAAAEHHLEYEHVLRASKKKLPKLTLSHRWQTLSDFKRRYAVDGELRLPVNDVYEASIVADTLLTTRPSRSGSYWRSLRRKAGLSARKA